MPTTLARTALVALSLLLLATALPAQEPAAETEARDTTPDSRIARQLKNLDLTYEIDDDGDYKLLFETDGDRSQLVWVMSQTFEYRGFHIREVWSYAYRSEDGVIPEAVANRLLEDSFDAKLGGWVKIDDSAVYVSKIAADADDDTLYAAMILTLEKADEMEAELPGDEDRY